MIWAPEKKLWIPKQRRGNLLFFPPLLRNRSSGVFTLQDLNPTVLLLSGIGYFQTVAGVAAGADNDPTGEWQDQSGNGNNVSQGTAANRPLRKDNIKNGLPILRFDGSNDSLASSAFSGALAQPGTLIVVAKFRTATGIVENVTDGIGTSNRWLLGKLDAPRQHRIFAGTTLSAVDTDTNFHLYIVSFNGASSFLRRDGTLIASGNAGAHTLTGLTLGSNFANTGQRLDGDIGDVIIVPRAIKGSEITKTESLLMTKWAL